MRVWTEEQRARQRENCRKNRPWERSTGPRTSAGKARCSRNAYDHGFRSRDMDRVRALLRQRRLLVIIALEDFKTGRPGKNKKTTNRVNTKPLKSLDSGPGACNVDSHE